MFLYKILPLFNKLHIPRCTQFMKSKEQLKGQIKKKAQLEVKRCRQKLNSKKVHLAYFMVWENLDKKIPEAQIW